MAYTKQLSISEEAETRLVNWLEEQLTNHYSERTSYMEDLKNWQRDYWAKPSSEPNTFPFLNSANIIIPLTAIAFEAVHARTMMTLFALPQFVSVKLPESFNDIDYSVERYLDHVMLRSIDVRKKLEPAIMEQEKFGTGIARTGYVENVRKAIFENADGTEEEIEVIIDKGATVDGVPNSRFLMPMEAQDPQTAPWCGEEHDMFPHQVKMYQASNFFKKGTIAKLMGFMVGPASETSMAQNQYENSIDDLQNRKPVQPTRLTFTEIWTDFDVNGDGYDEAICVWYHKDSRSIVSCRSNWFRDLRRPYRKGNYIPLEFRWTGVGIAKQNDQFQAEVTTQHRQRIDNGTIANTQMFKVNRNSGILQNEPIYPGKMWFLDSMDDVQAMPMSDIKASSYNNENQAVIFSQQRTGVNELTLGMPQVGTPGTATDSMARVQESARKFDYTYSNTRTFVTEIVQDTVCNLAQFGPRDVEFFEFLPQGPQVEQFFKNPVMYFRKYIIQEIQIVGVNSNRMLDRQNWQQVAQLVEKAFQSKITLAQGMQDADLVRTISTDALGAIDELLKQSLESFNLRNLDRILPNVGNPRPNSQPTQEPTEIIQQPRLPAPAPAIGNQTPDISALLSQLQQQQGGMFPSG